MAHFPLQAHGFLADSLSVLAGKAGLLNRDFRLATTCSFDGRSFLLDTAQQVILVQ